MENKQRRATIQCPLCDEKVVDQEALANHCAKRHSEDGADGLAQDYTVFSKEFETEDEYKRWFLEECKRNCITFWRRQKVHGRNSTRITLWCNRAGINRNTAKDRVRTTRKDNLYCSCFLNVEYLNSGMIVVKGCLGHAGHALDPALLRLSPDQQEYLKVLLEEHTFHYIIHRLRREHQDKKSRLFFVSRDDLWNLTKRFKIRPGCRDPVDLTSVSIRVEENNPNDGIRLFQHPSDASGKGFLMVIVTPLQLKWLTSYSSRGVSIDDTHHTTRYNIKLATLMVADEKDRGLPAAFLMSGTMTADDVARLFEVIRTLMPTFNPPTIVTDEAPCFFNGFRKVFPDASTEVRYCRIHIAKTWERKTREVVEAKIRPTVDKALRDLLKEGELDAFEQRFAEILAFLKAKKQTAMVEYLTKNYLGRTTMWASFRSKGSIMDTTMISERWHRILKEDILHRNSNCRIDCLIELLIRSVTEKANAIEIMDRRRFVKSSFRCMESIKTHRLAEKYYANKTWKIRPLLDNKFLVASCNDKEDFTVSRTSDCFCDAKANVHCPMCNICPYSWSCTCLDKRAGVNCVHRHAVKIHGHGMEQRDGSAELNKVAEANHLGALEEPPELGSAEDPADQQNDYQRRREQRYQKLHEIITTYAAVELKAKSLAKTDSNEALDILDQILGLMRLAADTCQLALSQLAPRPELNRDGAKPHIKCVELLPRAKMKKPKKQSAKDLHEEVRHLRSLSPTTPSPRSIK